MTRVALVKTRERITGVNRALDLLDLPSLEGKSLFLKPNYNSADPTPGSTHNDVLVALVRGLRALGAGPITVGDRSGMGDTRQVMQRKGIFGLAEELGFETHRFGGHFTLSLKNSVGLVAKQVPGDGYDYMSELHTSPHQRSMIAEINLAYQPDLVLLDGVEAFVEGGPDTGRRVDSQVVLAGTDRIAIDAVGVAMLRLFGTTPEVSRGPVFAQPQIARAVELGLGVSGPGEIELITGDAPSAAYAAQIHEALVRD
jgi:uncharacterized protein (DUF362 family)